jgi:hypothetical protein
LLGAERAVMMLAIALFGRFVWVACAYQNS